MVLQFIGLSILQMVVEKIIATGSMFVSDHSETSIIVYNHGTKLKVLQKNWWGKYISHDVFYRRILRDFTWFYGLVKEKSHLYCVNLKQMELI